MATGQKLYSTSWSTSQVLAELKRRSPKRAKVYEALLTHEFLSTAKLTKKISGKEDSHEQSKVSSHLNILRQNGLVISEVITGPEAKTGTGGHRPPLKHKKTKHPLLVPQKSPYAGAGGPNKQASGKAAKGNGKGGDVNTEPMGDGTPHDSLTRIAEAAEAMRVKAEELCEVIERETRSMARQYEDVGSMREDLAKITKRLGQMENKLHR